MNYLLHILIMIGIYIILSLSLNLLVGYTGLLSLCHAAFYGIGAYAATLFMTRLGVNFFPALLLAIVITMVASLVVSVPSLRLRGDYFVLASLGFQIIAFSILYNWVSFTRGPYGIPGIPRPTILGIEIGTLPTYFTLTAILTFLCFLVLWRISSSPFGRVLKAIREDELATKALGKNTTNLKIVSFMFAAGIAAVSGALYAAYVTYIDPTSFTIAESIFILSIVLIGGSGNLKGPILGAIFLVVLPEVLRFLNIPDTIAPNVRQMIYGAILVFLMRYRSQGIAGEYKFE